MGGEVKKPRRFWLIVFPSGNHAGWAKASKREAETLRKQWGLEDAAVVGPYVLETK